MSEEQTVQDIIADPEAHYDTPQAVLKDTKLDSEAKRKVLDSWRLDAMRLQASEVKIRPVENRTGWVRWTGPSVTSRKERSNGTNRDIGCLAF